VRSHEPRYAAALISALDELETLHDAAPSQAHQNYYLKLALLELCGWIEQTQDIVLSRLGGYWLELSKSDFYNELKNNSGFAYHANFRKLLLRLIGMRGVEQLEARIAEHADTGVAKICTEMFSLLNDTLKLSRNMHAHTFAGVQNVPLRHLLHFTFLKQAAITVDIGLQLLEREICGC
jgi:hypothetical protein